MPTLKVMGSPGVEDASHKYFAVSAAELNLEQAKLLPLLACSKGQKIYNPYYSIENATNRRNTVLQAMVNASYIDQATADARCAGWCRPAISMIIMLESRAITAIHLILMRLLPKLLTAMALKESDIINNGYRIYTEMDQTSQANMQVIYNDESMFPVSTYDGQSARND